MELMVHKRYQSDFNGRNKTAMEFHSKKGMRAVLFLIILISQYELSLLF